MLISPRLLFFPCGFGKLNKRYAAHASKLVHRNEYFLNRIEFSLGKHSLPTQKEVKEKTVFLFNVPPDPQLELVTIRSKTETLLPVVVVPVIADILSNSKKTEMDIPYKVNLLCPLTGL